MKMTDCKLLTSLLNYLPMKKIQYKSGLSDRSNYHASSMHTSKLLIQTIIQKKTVR